MQLQRASHRGANYALKLSARPTLVPSCRCRAAALQLNAIRYAAGPVRCGGA
jgi:hypothetical protein